MNTPVDWDVNNPNEQNVDYQSSSSSLTPLILFDMDDPCNFPMAQIHALTVFLSNRMNFSYRIVEQRRLARDSDQK